MPKRGTGGGFFAGVCTKFAYLPSNRCFFWGIAIRFAQHKKRNVSLLSRTKATDQGDLRSAKKLTQKVQAF
ncbi:MAG: hypothetical protein SO182_03675 [Paludibacteraceae bacterium]|nr:hypothetical protein [Paludibacteraceae bacterium]